MSNIKNLVCSNTIFKKVSFMESIQIRNIRSLTDTGSIRIAPITLLVGQNSSGKSTFARLFPMLKQGSEARTREPFLWLGRLVDFGSAQDAFSRFPTKGQLGISIKQKVSSHLLDARRRMWPPSGPTPAAQEIVNLSIDYCFSEQLTKWDSPNITDTQLSSRSVFQTLPGSIH